VLWPLGGLLPSNAEYDVITHHLDETVHVSTERVGGIVQSVSDEFHAVFQRLYVRPQTTHSVPESTVSK